MSNDERPQRPRQFIDRDMMSIAMSIWGMPALRAAQMIVGKVSYEGDDRGVHTVRYGDASSQVGEAFLRDFVRLIIEARPETFNEELFARAKRGDNVTRDEPTNRIEPSAEQVAEIRARVRSAF